jgi:hypothetical protein
MNREEALSLLDARLDQYRKLSYAELGPVATQGFLPTISP